MTLPTADVLAAVDADIDGSLERLFDWLRMVPLLGLPRVSKLP